MIVGSFVGCLTVGKTGCDACSVVGGSGKLKLPMMVTGEALKAAAGNGITRARMTAADSAGTSSCFGRSRLH